MQLKKQWHGKKIFSVVGFYRDRFIGREKYKTRLQITFQLRHSTDDRKSSTRTPEKKVERNLNNESEFLYIFRDFSYVSNVNKR